MDPLCLARPPRTSVGVVSGYVMSEEVTGVRLLAAERELNQYDFDGFVGQGISGWTETAPTEWTIEMAFTNRDAGRSTIVGSLTVEFQAAGTAEVIDAHAYLEGDELSQRTGGGAAPRP